MLPTHVGLAVNWNHASTGLDHASWSTPHHVGPEHALAHAGQRVRRAAGNDEVLRRLDGAQTVHARQVHAPVVLQPRDDRHHEVWPEPERRAGSDAAG